MAPLWANALCWASYELTDSKRILSGWNLCSACNCSGLSWRGQPEHENPLCRLFEPMQSTSQRRSVL